MKKTSTLNPAMICPYCGKKQYQTQKSKTKMSFLTPIVLMPLLLQMFIDIPGVYLMSLFFVLGVAVFLIYPFLIEINSKEEYINIPKDKQ